MVGCNWWDEHQVPLLFIKSNPPPHAKDSIRSGHAVPDTVSAFTITRVSILNFQNQISNMFLTNIQQIYAKWWHSSCVLVLSTWQISLKGVASTSHLSPPERKIRARRTIEQPNQCLMNIFGCYCVPYDESHQGKRYNLKSSIEAIFSLHHVRLRLTWKF